MARTPTNVSKTRTKSVPRFIAVAIYAITFTIWLSDRTYRAPIENPDKISLLASEQDGSAPSLPRQVDQLVQVATP
jgi:hypothetical protein